MNKEQIKISTEVDAAILQYAAEKKFKKQHWYWSMPVRAAALFAVVAGLATMQFFNRPTQNKTALLVAESRDTAVLDWNDFEEKLEYMDDEIIEEAKYLAQL